MTGQAVNVQNYFFTVGRESRRQTTDVERPLIQRTRFREKTAPAGVMPDVRLKTAAGGARKRTFINLVEPGRRQLIDVHFSAQPKKGRTATAPGNPGNVSKWTLVEAIIQAVMTRPLCLTRV